ncbi:MAG: hypothetical protein H6739_23535 [Alphaproteobacteria bacterium]|nr:hypothetical protein [Alphaproteobacteria bacterium]
MSRTSPLSLAPLFVAACLRHGLGAAPPESAALSDQEAFARAEEGERFGLRLQLSLSRGGEALKPVPLNTPICEGDQLLLTAIPSETGYITILGRGSSGQLAQLHPAPCVPQATDLSDCVVAPFSPDTPARLPAEGVWKVDDQKGEESLVLVVSKEPLSSKEIRRVMVLLGEDVPVPAGLRGPTSTPPRPSPKPGPGPRPDPSPEPAPPEDDCEIDPRACEGGERGPEEILWIVPGDGSLETFIVGEGAQAVAFTLEHRSGCSPL